jgi:hypothetical protein
MTSKLKIAANRKNSRLSTGPSEESKAWTRYNRVTHGLRSRVLLLPGENQLELDELRETWVNKLKPCDPAEDELVADVVNGFWMHRRADRALFEHLNARIGEAKAREEEGVARDIRRLFSDVRGPHSMYCTSSASCGGPYTSWPTGNAENPDEPSMLVGRLESSEKGCLALIGHWRMLKDRLEQGLVWQPQDRLKSIRMLGRQPIELIEDERVMLIYIGSFALHPLGRKHPLEDLKCEMEAPDLDAFLDRAQSRWPLILDASDTATAKQALLDLVDDSLKRLDAKVLAYREMAAEAAASRSRRLAGDGSPEAERLKRYELANSRRADRCLDAFYKHKRESEKDGGRRTEDGGGGFDEGGGRRAEDGGDGYEAENGADSGSELGVAGSESTLGNRNLTTEANSGEIGMESGDLKEVEALRKLLAEAPADLSAWNKLGTGPIGAGVVGGGTGLAAIASAIFAGKPLLPPIS